MGKVAYTASGCEGAVNVEEDDSVLDGALVERGVEGGGVGGHDGVDDDV